MRTRRSFESGHRPKLLVVVDETTEGDRALYFAARRAARLGAGLVMLRVVELGETQVFLGVGDIMKAEAEEEAQALLAKAAERVRSIAGVEPELVMREGATATELARLVEADEDISFLVLAAATEGEGPGPLVAALATKAGLGLPIPVIIVPGDLKDAEIDALAG